MMFPKSESDPPSTGGASFSKSVLIDGIQRYGVADQSQSAALACAKGADAKAEGTAEKEDAADDPAKALEQSLKQGKK